MTSVQTISPMPGLTRNDGMLVFRSLTMKCPCRMTWRACAREAADAHRATLATVVDHTDDARRRAALGEHEHEQNQQRLPDLDVVGRRIPGVERERT